jgi:hypothetical protein
MTRRKLTEKQMLAAETFGYSYAHYADHLTNPRFSKLMLADVDILEQAEVENWPIDRIAMRLEMPSDAAERNVGRFRRAKEIIEASVATEMFRVGVRQSIELAIADGLDSPEAIEKLVAQIGYRTVDLGYLLEADDMRISDVSNGLKEK